MRDLRFVGLSEDGTHLLLLDEDEQQHRLVIDDALRAGVRGTGGATAVRATSGAAAPSTSAPADPDRPVARPRDVQAFLRSGMTIAEVAERSGWTVEKVGLFEPPIRAERDHVAFTAQNLTIPSRGSSATTVGDRVNERLEQRGVILADVTWDAYRTERGWTVVCRFPAGGRPRVATWRFDGPTRSVHPTDDEARWLSEDDAPTVDAPVPTGLRAASPEVYDVIAEGGLDSKARPRKEPVRPGRIPHATVTEPEPSTDHPSDDAAATDDEGTDGSKSGAPVDLVSVMRERSRRRRTAPRKKPAAGASADSDASDATDADSSADEAKDAGKDSKDARKEAPEPKPTVDDLGHDPVTGTADLFGLREVEYRREGGDAAPADKAVEKSADEVADEPAEPASADEPAEDTVDEKADETPCDDTAEPESDDRPSDADRDESANDDSVPERPSQARKGRPSVPSWDDIMFGKRPRS